MAKRSAHLNRNALQIAWVAFDGSSLYGTSSLRTSKHAAVERISRVAGGRPPRGNDFAVYDPATDKWEVLPGLPSQRNHMTGAVINGRIHVVGGRLGPGLSPLKTTAHEVFDPQTKTWTSAASMLSGRSGMNGVMARGCFHIWGGEDVTGMTPNHEYYDPRTNQWSHVRDMPIPIHGINDSVFKDGLIWVVGGGTDIGGAHASHHNQVFRPTVSCE